MKYNSLLYGNGLTLKLVAEIKAHLHCEGLFELEHIVDMNSYINHISSLESHKREILDFRKTFRGFEFFVTKNNCVNGKGELLSKQKSDLLWESALKIIAENNQQINAMGAERWISSILFAENFDQEIRPYKEVLYSLYNYWYNQFRTKIYSIPQIRLICKRYAQEIVSHNFNEIFTINFDTLLDEWISPSHLHGKFINYSNFQELRIFEYRDEVDHKNRFEYPYLYGANGIEKGKRLERIVKYDAAKPYYDTEFFFSDTLNLKHLLIYGVGFGSTAFMDTFKGSHPQYDDCYYVNSVDGHILLRMSALREQCRLNSITVAYYSDADRENYTRLLENAKLLDISTIVPIKEIEW